MSGTGLELPPSDPPSDDDRRRVIDLLRGASIRLGLDEVERRMAVALQAASRGDLALLVWDLPDTTAAAPAVVAGPRVGAWQDFSFRMHSTAYLLTNGMLVGIWELTGGHGLFWPFFPIAGWGIGLAAHGVASRAVQRRRHEKESRRLTAPTLALAGATPQARLGRVRPARVVVMFTDVVDSTRLTMVIGDEDWTRVRRRYREMLHDCYRAYQGREVSSQGDGFLARFDRPADAVGCAVEIQTRLLAQREEIGFAPAVRIGINAGDVVEEHGDVLGTTVNLAARVTAAAEPNEILVTEVVADRLDGRFEVQDGGLREMKGLDRTAHVLSVSWQ
jgi:class 3 adenylate cyclase